MFAIGEKIKDDEQLRIIWQEMEILNACVLSDWEDDGSPIQYDEKWNMKYKKDAESLVAKLIEILEVS
jgi:hypothetical protein